MSEERRPLSRGDVRQWVSYLKEIGVRELHVSSVPGPTAPGAGDARPPEASARPAPPPPPARPAARTPASAPAKQRQLGLAAEPPSSLEAIRDEIGDCTRCPLHEQRTHIVFGVGSPGAGLMFIGEGPGADEDAQGEPFVGRAGKKLDEMIRAIGLEREEVYIANVVKCRPPGNRDPRPDEVATCSPFLFKQIAAIRPKVIVTLGSPATKTLLRTSAGITRLRGEWHEFEGIPVMPTFHPAYLLRAYTKENRAKVWEDLQAARARLDE